MESTCPICFEILSDKIKASPDNCEHVFCFPCLEKWSKLGSYCPVDRKRFKKILNLDSEDLIQVKPRKRKRKRILYDFTSKCEVCSGITDSNVLLLCDCCDLAYHIYCLCPPLKEVPAGLWFCPTCISVEEKLKKKNGITKQVEVELGGFDSKLLYEAGATKKARNDEAVVPQKLSNPAPVKKNKSILQACHDIISEFEDMTVRKNCSKNASSSNYLDCTINKIDKIYKTFDVVSKDANHEDSKRLKTYSVTNIHKKTKSIKPFDVEQMKKTYQNNVSLNTIDTCLNKNSVSSDIILENHTLTGSVPYEFPNVGALYEDDEFSMNETEIKEMNSNVDSNLIELFSEDNDIHSDEFLGNFPLQNKQELNPLPMITSKDTQNFECGDMPELQNNLLRTSRKKSLDENMPVLKKISTDRSEKKQKKFNKDAVTSDADNNLPSTSCVRDKSFKEKHANKDKDNFNSTDFQHKAMFSEIHRSPKSVSPFQSSCASSPYLNCKASTSNTFFGSYNSEEDLSSTFHSEFLHDNRDDSSSDNESLNSDSSHETIVYNTSTVDIHKKDLFSTETEEELECNQNEKPTSFNESEKNSLDIEHESSPNTYLSRSALRKHLHISSDGSLYLDWSVIKNCNTETKSLKNKPTSSYLSKSYNEVPISNNETIFSEKSLPSDEKCISDSEALSENCKFALNKEPISDDERFAEIPECASEDSEYNFENLIDDENQEPLSEKSVSMNLHDLKYPINPDGYDIDLQLIPINPDGTHYSKKPALPEIENLTEELKTSSEHDSSFGVRRMPLTDESTINSKYLSQNKQSQLSSESVSSDHITQNKQSQSSSESVSSDHITQNEQSQSSNESVNSDHIIQNEQSQSSSESVNSDHITQKEQSQSISESVNSDHITQNEQSQSNSESVSSDHITQNEKFTHEPEPFCDDDSSDEIQILQSSFGANKSNIDSKPPFQNVPFEDTSRINASPDYKSVITNQKEKIIPFEESIEFVQRDDGLFFDYLPSN